ncbi:hypothetical protein Y032_0181g859 [Ancylostoma ceylanicum]|uniref:K Homology domain-containing protein n=3 Tax=Ancylostoma TaxID=29169 RepID=A0A016SS74_9BILA|nr:hypothetical protein Y032_0181g859 [Ancylostoma ceylanicum]
MAGLLQYSTSRGSEEGFHSGSDEAIDNIAYQLYSQFRLDENHFEQHKCASDSGTSSGELEHMLGMKEESTGCQGQLPGAWFYEMGDDASASPTFDLDEMGPFRGILGSRNCSESVEVPSSEHVAEIVGRQGCKIKALRAKTNTYIKTPIRGEDPVFVVTGKAEDVLEAKREIECAAEHFTQIRASRRHSHGGAPAPGHVTLYVRVPLRVVGLVVGPKGATIKRIQQDTHTYIITPSREREPIFEVTGLPQNVEAARKEIEQHIYQRTGNMPMTDPEASISQYSSLQNNLSLAASASAAARSAYGSLAQPPVRRPVGNENLPEYSRVMDRNGYNGLSGLLRGYPQPTKPSSYSAGGSPPAVSPSFFGSSSSSTTSTAFQPWSNNLYTGLGLSDAASDLFSTRSSVLSGASLWSSGFGSMSCGQQIPSNQRDEGLGDSPPNNVSSTTYNLMSSIWADIDAPREPESKGVAMLTV